MIVTTTPTVEGYRITGYYGIVFGEVITGINFLKDFGAGIRNLVGGRSAGYEEELMVARTQALEELQQRGVKLGADIPYCLQRGTALAEGIGEQLTVLPKAPNCFVLLAKPKVHVSTKFVYGNLRAGELSYHPDIDGQIQAIRDGDFYKMAELMGNVLETVTVPAFPVIREIKDTMLHYGAVNAMMSGSGPTVFGLFDDRTKAKAAYSRLRGGSIAKEVFLTRFFHNRAEV